MDEGRLGDKLMADAKPGTADAVDATEDLAQDIDDAVQDSLDQPSDSDDVASVDDEGASTDTDYETEEPSDADPVGDAYPDNSDLYGENDERHQSLSSRVLTWLAVLAAGAGIALWGGPKLAPQLPEWAAPVSKFLTPGGDAALRDVTALRTEVSEKLDAVPAVPTEDDIAALIAAQVDARAEQIKGETDAQVEELRAQLNSTDTSTMDARITTLESQLEGLTAEIAALTSSVQTAMEQDGSISEEALAEITMKSAEVEGVRAQVTEMSTQIAALTQRVEDAEGEAKARLAAAEANAQQAQEEAEQIAANAARQASLEALTDKVQAGEPFAAELSSFSEATGEAIPEAVAAVSEAGLTPVPALKTQLTELSHQAIRASIKAEGDASGNAASKFGAFLKSQVATRSLEPSEGDGTDAVLSRISAALDNGNLAEISTEAERLSVEARTPLEGWLEDIKTRNTVLETLAMFASQQS